MALINAPNTHASGSYRIALADDHTSILLGVEQMLLAIGGYDLVLKALNGKELVDALSNGLEVDIALVDLRMPVMNGFEAIACIAANRPDVRVVAMSQFDTSEYIVPAMRAGACGYTIKSMGVEELRTTLNTVAQTGSFIPDEVRALLLEHEILARTLKKISTQERRFLVLASEAKEWTYEQIAEFMGVSKHTIDGYFRELARRFNFHTRAGLVRFALEHGLAGHAGSV